MSGHSFLERPHDALRAKRTCNYTPIDDAALCSKTLVLVVLALLGAAAFGAVVLTLIDLPLPI